MSRCAAIVELFIHLTAYAGAARAFDSDRTPLTRRPAGPCLRGQRRSVVCRQARRGCGSTGAEGVGFEPTRSKLLAVFKTAAIGH